MKLIVLATQNKDKVREIKKILSGFAFLTLDDFPGLPPAEETGATIAENAIIKARSAARLTQHTALADDSGLEVKALGGRPGVKSARFAGPGASYSDNNAKLLKLMEGAEDREAVFKCVIAVAEPGGNVFTREGLCSGFIAPEPRGANGFGYDPVFLAEDTGKTFAELSEGEKNAFSHRRRALEQIKKSLSKRAGLL